MDGKVFMRYWGIHRGMQFSFKSKEFFASFDFEILNASTKRERRENRATTCSLTLSDCHDFSRLTQNLSRNKND